MLSIPRSAEPAEEIIEEVEDAPARGPLEHVDHHPDRQPLDRCSNDRSLQIRERVDSACIVHGAQEAGSQSLLESLVRDAMLTQEAVPRIPIWRAPG